jgi:hypothetical protein
MPNRFFCVVPAWFPQGKILVNCTNLLSKKLFAFFMKPPEVTHTNPILSEGRELKPDYDSQTNAADPRPPACFTAHLLRQ